MDESKKINNVSIGNTLVLSFPEGFKPLSNDELGKLTFFQQKPDICLFDKVKRIWVSIGCKEIPWFSSIISTAEDISKKMEKSVRNAMMPFGYKCGGIIHRMIGDRQAICFCYSYEAKGKSMEAEVCLVKHKQTLWFFNLYYQAERKEESLLEWGNIMSSAVWKIENREEKQIKKSDLCYKEIRKTLDRMNNAPHIISLPVIIQNDGMFYLAVYEFFFTREDIESAMVNRPTVWAVADICSGEVVHVYDTKENEFSSASYDVKYNIQEDKEEKTDKDIFVETFDMLDKLRRGVIKNGSLDDNDYQKYMKYILNTVPADYQQFYIDLNKRGEQWTCFFSF